MTFSLLCDEPTVQVCPPRFRVKASAWIDASNIGDTAIQTPPPAGIRLRWNCPFLIPEPTDRIGKPIEYDIERSGPINPNLLWLPVPTVGHVPRTSTIKELWGPLRQINSIMFTVDGDSCRGVDAVYFEIPVGAPKVRVTLITTDGANKVTGEVEGGDIFYFELSDVKTVLFSGENHVTKVSGLFLGSSEGVPAEFHSIATVNAEGWLVEPLSSISERIANPSGAGYVTVDAQSWAVLQGEGQKVAEAFDRGHVLPERSVNALQISGAISWEAATLMGWGFVDGEHPTYPQIDNIQLSEMLQGVNNTVYAYRVTAVLLGVDGRKKRIHSVPCFALASFAPQLAPVECRPTRMPISRSRITNMIDIGASPTKPIVISAPHQRVYCSTSWDIETKLPATELIYSRPVANDSALTGEAFVDPGEFSSGSSPTLIRVHGLSETQRRDLQFDVPYFDSDVGLELTAGDSWDRRKRQTPTPMIQPLIEYEGNCIPVGSAICDGNLGIDGRGSVTITLNQGSAWEADPLATGGGGVIHLLMKDPEKTLLEAGVVIGPAFPVADGNWAAEVEASLAQAEFDRFVGGTLVVDGMIANVKGISPHTSNHVICTFEVTEKCAGVILYLTPNGTAKAYLREDPQSDRFWIDLGNGIAVLNSGLPAKYTEKLKLPPLEYSMTLSFATKLVVEFEGEEYVGTISNPCPAPYIHPAPEAPKVCIVASQLGTDYYGRAVLRVSADGCPHFDHRHFAVRATMSPGEKLLLPEFLAGRSEGFFGSQTVFERGHMFEAFDDLARLAEASAFTIGISYVRKNDGRESDAALEVFTVKKMD